MWGKKEGTLKTPLNDTKVHFKKLKAFLITGKDYSLNLFSSNNTDVK